jgi:hypothetical protein
MQKGLLKISGTDAKKFLQGQLTCNMEDVTSQGHLAAHCNPQGRIISLFHIFLHQNNYYLLMPVNMVPIAIAALKKYAVFYKVGLESIPLSELPFPALDTTGIPAIYPETSGKFLPHELNLHQLNAISFDKGCYTGQEIIARMHYRGKLKKHLYQAIVNTSAAPLPGTEVYYLSDQSKQPGGTIVDSAFVTLENHCTILLVCDEENAKNDHLFLEPDHQFLSFHA